MNTEPELSDDTPVDSASVDDTPRDDVLELRVLSGLQAGAALPLEDGLVAGSGDEADLLLLDDGIAATQLRVRATPEGGLLLEGLATGVGVATRPDIEPGTPVIVAIGEPFRARTVWLTVRRTSDAWEPWAAPAAAPDGVTIVAASDVPAEAPVIAADPRPGRTREPGAAPARRPMRALGSVIVASGLLSTMLGVAALVRQAVEVEAQAAPAGPEAPAAPSATSSRSASASASASAQSQDAALDAGPLPGPAATASAPAITRDAEPVGRVERAAGGDRLVVRLPDDGTVTLPFDIREVLLGAQSHVVLTDGRHLEPGDRVGEWRLVDIRPGALVFDGPRKVMVGW